ncbi:MAG: metal ABC transporter permease [Candidatus Heimdallarchaeota archaeon]|nr:metal ABC transporter permease [Candidatus Heimdallarchaeota archaeon]
MDLLFLFSKLSLQLLFKVILGASLAGMACSLIGVFVVHLKITAIGFSMSHAAFAGAALGLLINSYLAFDPLISASIFAIAVALLLGPMSEKTRLNPNVVLGIIFTLSLALGFIFLSFLPSGVVSSEAVQILWGSVFGLNWVDFLLLGLVNLAIVGIIIIFYKEFLATMFHRKVALAAGINVSFFNFLILFLTALTVSFTLKIVGALLVYALIVNPTSTVYQFAYDTKKIFIFSPVVGIISAIGGVLLSFMTNFPVGSSIIIVSSVIFVVSVIFSPKKRRRIVQQHQ